MPAFPVLIRYATAEDAPAVADLASALAQSFAFSRTKFDVNYAVLLDQQDACLLVADDGHSPLGYLLSASATRPSTPMDQWPQWTRFWFARAIGDAASAAR